MSAGIMEFDKGVVQGTTWHGLPQYITQDMPVTFDQAMKVMDFPTSKRRLYVDIPEAEGNRTRFPVDAWSIVRDDIKKVIVPSVGKDFTLLNNGVLLDFVWENFIDKYEDLSIESVGTLWNGATSFVNIKLDEFQVRGDKSPTISRMMYYNPLGKGSYKVCAHDVRIVCNNTLQMAEAQGSANKTLTKIRHTATAADRISESLVDIAVLKMQLQKHQGLLNNLATMELNGKELKEYLDTLLPTTVEMPQQTITRVENKRNAILDIFESDQDMVPDVARSRYGILNAVTNWVDHQIPNSLQDEASVAWDSIVGNRANFKSKALQLLVA